MSDDPPVWFYLAFLGCYAAVCIAFGLFMVYVVGAT